MSWISWKQIRGIIPKGKLPPYLRSGWNFDDSGDGIAGHVNDSSIHLNSENVQDIVDGLLVEGSNITLTYDDANDTLTIAASGAGDAVDEAAMNNWFF